MPVGTKRFDEDVFDGQGVLVVRVEFAAALGLAEVEPVGSPLAGAAEARGFAEGFQQDGSDAVAAVPVGGQLPLAAGEQVGGEMGDADPGQDQEAGVVDDACQIAFAGGRVPADEAVAGGSFPGGGGEAEQGQQEAVAGLDEVAQLGAGQVLVAEIVVAVDELVPGTAAGVLGAQGIEAQRADIGERAGQGEQAGRIGGRGGRDRTRARQRSPRGRQGEQAVALHAQQGYAGAHLLETAVGLAPVQRRAQRAGQRGAVQARLALRD